MSSAESLLKDGTCLTSTCSNADYNITDEALTIDKEQFDQEVAPTNRGNEPIFGKFSKNPVYKHHGNTFLSSMPYENSQKWLLEPAKYYEEERGVHLFDVWNKVVRLQMQLIDAKAAGDRSLFREIWNEVCRLRKTITPFVSKDGTLFILASIFDNIANVGLSYVMNQYGVMDKLTFMIEILNYIVDKIDNCYYNLDERHKYYNATNDSYIQDFAENTDFNWAQLEDAHSLMDADCNPNKPLEIVFDWGSSGSFMEVAQESNYDWNTRQDISQKYPGRVVDNTINEFFVHNDESDTMVNALVDKFIHYYRFHVNKMVDFYRDRYGDHRSASSKRTYNEIAIRRLESSGWTVRQFTHRGMEPPQHDKYLLWGFILSEKDERYPIKRFNASKCKHILYRFGRMPEENVQKLDFYSDAGFIFQAYHTAHDYVWGFYFATKARIPSVDAIMKGLLFERYELPEDISGTPEEALAEMQIKLTEKKAALEELEKQQAEIYKTESEQLGKMYRFAKYQSEVWKLRGQCIITQDKFSLMGYVPVSEKENFKKHIGKVPDLSVTYEAPWVDSKVQPPVRLKNGWFTKPFSMFVEMYGLPNYNGYNPTTFVAITYTLIFGIMFGDLGQGILLALIGMFLHKKKNFELGAIMARIGVSSAVFGALYGSVFGFEEALDPFWEKLGIPFLPLKAMENTNVIIFGAVGIGAALVIISILVNIIVKLRRHNYEEAVFGNNGIAGLVFFSGLLLVVLGIVTGKQLISKPVTIILLVIPLLLMFFREPLGHWMAHKHYEMPGIGDFIASNFFECFEFLLGYATNTLSFIRIGGFVFSHAGLMSVVMLLSEMIGKDHKSIITIIIGNLFVMCLEGLIVGIQVLRLEFYEIFSRCYDGDGKPFTPISVTFDDFNELKQSEQTANA